jgi:inorganic pyrophosphatase
MIDGGQSDEKILAVPVKNPRYKSIKTLDDLEPHILDEIKHFFEQYKKLEKKEVEVKNWEPRENALAALKEAHENFKKNG